MQYKILYVITGLDIGGAERTLLRLVCKLDIPKESLLIVSLTDIGPIGKELIDNGFSVKALHLSGIKSLLSVSINLYQLISVFRPDIVHTWLYHADLLGGLTARLAGCRNIAWCIRTTKLKKGSYATAIIRQLCALASYFVPGPIIFAANASHEFHHSIGYSKRDPHVIPNGYDFSLLQYSESDRDILRKQCGIQEDDIVIGCLGRYSHVKGQDLLIKAFSGVVSRHENVKLLFVGRGMEDDNQELACLLDQQGVNDYTLLLGERDDISACLSAMDIYCLPSRSEGFPNALSEAMAIGLPCITTDAGDASIIVSDYGIVIPTESTDAITSSILSLIDMPADTRALMASRGAEHIRNRYSLDKMISSYTDVYTNMLTR